MKARLESARCLLFAGAALASVLIAAPASGQERRGYVYGTLGWAGIGHADSEQGKAPIFGGGVAFQLAPKLMVEGDVHGARIEQVFGREHHNFTQITLTGSVLFRAPIDEKVDLLAGGGIGVQRAHTDFTVDPVGRVERTESVRLFHAKAGLQWHVADRWAIRTEGVFWMGSGLDWVVGARVGLGYRF